MPAPDCMTVPADRPLAPRWRSGDRLVLCLILLVAAAVRVPHLDRPGYSYDESWKAELAAGNGSPHLRLPVDTVFRAIDLSDPPAAAPWWRVWTTMECTHPPLYYLGLRAWSAVFGHGDAAERAFAVVTSVAAVGLLFDAARLSLGRTVAAWAGLLMAVAGPQVEHARLASNYALELATVLAAADALVRVEVLGPTRPRLAALAVAVLAAALTHYFAAGALAGLAAHAAVRLRGRARVAVAGAFTAAAVAFLLCWGPFLWAQRPLFATDDPATRFLQDGGPGHAARVLAAALAAPGQMLAGRGPGRWGLAPLYVLPLILARRRPGLRVWAALLLGAVGLIVGLDLTRQTLHASYPRYLILAGPPTFVLVPAVAAGLRVRWLRWLIPAAGVAACVATLGRTLRVTTVDPRQVAAGLAAVAGPSDLIVFVGVGPRWWTANANCLILTRYARPFPSPVALEYGRPGPAVLRQVSRARRVVVLDADGGDPRGLFPDTTTVNVIDAGGGPAAWVLRPTPRPAGP